MAEGDWIFFGTDPTCGHVVAAVVDSKDHKSDTAKMVAGMVRDGCEISRRPNQEGLTWCSEECPAMIAARARRKKAR